MTQLIKHKRSTTPDGEPTTLEQGEVAFNIVDDPVKGWIGTPSGVKRLFSGEAVIVSSTAPTGAPINTFWFNDTDGTLQIFYDDGTSTQWVMISGPVGPKGPTGPNGGTFPDANSDGKIYGRKDGAWQEIKSSGVIVSPTAPTDAAPDTLWWDSKDGGLYIRFDNHWVATSPSG